MTIRKGMLPNPAENFEGFMLLKTKEDPLKNKNLPAFNTMIFLEVLLHAIIRFMENFSSLLPLWQTKVQNQATQLKELESSIIALQNKYSSIKRKANRPGPQNPQHDQNHENHHQELSYSILNGSITFNQSDLQAVESGGVTHWFYLDKTALETEGCPENLLQQFSGMRKQFVGAEGPELKSIANLALSNSLQIMAAIKKLRTATMN